MRPSITTLIERLQECKKLAEAEIIAESRLKRSEGSSRNLNLNSSHDETFSVILKNHNLETEENEKIV